MSQENVLLRKVLYMASIIKDASMVDVGRSRHTHPAWLWGFFLPSCASRVVAVVNTFAQATLSPTRARNSTLAMQNTASRSMVFQCAPFWVMGAGGLSMARSDSPDKTGKKVLRRRRAEMLLPQKHVSIVLSFLHYFLLLTSSSISVISNKHRINQ